MSDQDLPDPELDPALRERFAVLDDIEAPDTWPRTAAGSGRRAPGRWIGAAAVVAMIAAAIGWAVARDDQTTVTAGDEPGGEPGDDAPAVFSECPVTLPPPDAFTPPEAWPATPSVPDAVWYGTDDLWTVLDTEGHTPRKSVWWSAAFPGGAAEPEPEIAVIYRRLDEPDEDIDLGPRGTNAFTPQDGSFMIAGIEPDEPACWQATATYKGATLSYVYEVPAGTAPSSLPPASDGGVDGPLMFSAPWDPATGVEYADLTGTIEVEGDCVFLRNGDVNPILWPYGSRWQAEPPGVFTPTGDFVAVGGQVSGGGGYHAPDDLEWYVQDGEALAMAERCADSVSGGVAVFQGGGIDVVPVPSQSQDDAERDGVVAAVAALSKEDRVDVLTDADAPEGTWTLSRIPYDRIDPSLEGVLGDPDGVYPDDYVFAVDYAEILLLDADDRIVRAYPFPGSPPSWVLIADDAVFAGGIGDGGLPDSTLVRIDRASLEADVLLIPAPFDGGSAWPEVWRIATPEQTQAYESAVGFAPYGATGTPAESWIGEVVVDLDRVRALMGSVFG